MSHVTCPMSLKKEKKKKMDKVVKLVGGGSVMNGATPSSLFKDEGTIVQFNIMKIDWIYFLFFFILFLLSDIQLFLEKCLSQLVLNGGIFSSSYLVQML